MPSPSLSQSKNRITILPPGIRFNVFAVVLLLAGVSLGWVVAAQQRNVLWLGMGAAVGVIFGLSPRVANQWERAHR